MPLDVVGRVFPILDMPRHCIAGSNWPW
jgi:hypothetical protein